MHSLATPTERGAGLWRLHPYLKEGEVGYGAKEGSRSSYMTLCWEEGDAGCLVIDAYAVCWTALGELRATGPPELNGSSFPIPSSQAISSSKQKEAQARWCKNTGDKTYLAKAQWKGSTSNLFQDMGRTPARFKSCLGGGSFCPPCSNV